MIGKAKMHVNFYHLLADKYHRQVNSSNMTTTDTSSSASFMVLTKKMMPLCCSRPSKFVHLKTIHLGLIKTRNLYFIFMTCLHILSTLSFTFTNLLILLKIYTETSYLGPSRIKSIYRSRWFVTVILSSIQSHLHTLITEKSYIGQTFSNIHKFIQNQIQILQIGN